MSTEEQAVSFDAFISYSRKDKAFALALHAYLEANGKRIWMDQRDIAHAVDFMDEIREGIEKGENFIFLISPDSIASMVCGLEVDYAEQHHKRMIPVLVRDTKVDQIPASIARLNWVLSDNQTSEQVNATVLQVMQTDQAHIKMHTAILNKAIAWEKGGKARSLLLRGKSLEIAQDWRTEKADKEPLITTLQSNYISASRKWKDRMNFYLFGGVFIALIVSVMLGLYALSMKNEAENQQQLAETRADIAESRQFAFEATNLMDEEPQLSGLLVMKGYNVHPTSDAKSVLLTHTINYEKVYGFLEERIATQVTFSLDGKYVICNTKDHFSVSEVASLKKVSSIQTPHILTKTIETGDGFLITQYYEDFKKYTFPALELVDSFVYEKAKWNPAISPHGTYMLAELQNDSLYYYSNPFGKNPKLNRFYCPNASITHMVFDKNDRLIVGGNTHIFHIDLATDSILNSALIADLVPDFWQFYGSVNSNTLLLYGNNDAVYTLDVNAMDIKKNMVFTAKSEGQTMDRFQAQHSKFTVEENSIIKTDNDGNISYLDEANGQEINLRVFGKKHCIDMDINPAGTLMVGSFRNKNVVLIKLTKKPYNKGISHYRSKLTPHGKHSFIQDPYSNYFLIKSSSEEILWEGKSKHAITYYFDETEKIVTGLVKRKNGTFLTRQHLQSDQIDTIKMETLGLRNTYLDTVGRHLFGIQDVQADSSALFVVYDLKTAKITHQIAVPRPKGTANAFFSADASKVAIYSNAPRYLITSWDLATNALDTLFLNIDSTSKFGLMGSENCQMTYSHHHKYLATSISAEIAIFNLETGQIIVEFPGDGFIPQYFLFDQTDEYFFAAGGRKTLNVWNTQSGRQISRIVPHHQSDILTMGITKENDLISEDVTGIRQQSPLNIDKQLEGMQRKINRDFTPEEEQFYLRNNTP